MYLCVSSNLAAGAFIYGKKTGTTDNVTALIKKTLAYNSQIILLKQSPLAFNTPLYTRKLQLKVYV